MVNGGGDDPTQSVPVAGEVAGSVLGAESTEAAAIFRAAFQTSPDAINVNRLADGVYIDANEGFTALTGWRRDEVIGRPTLEVGIWVDPGDRIRLLDGLRAGGAVTNLEARFRLKDGREHTGLLSARIFHLGGVAFVLTVTRDIEDWKNAQAGYATFLALVENSKEFVSIGTLDGRVDYLNPAGREMVGLTEPAEAVGRPISDYLDEGSRQNVAARLLPALRDPGFLTGEARLRHFGTGQAIDVEYSAFALAPEDTGGPTARIAVVARDVSERKRSMQLLAANEARYRRIFENIVDVYVETGPDGVVLEVSPSIERLFGFTREEAVGHLRPHDNYADPGVREEIVRRLGTDGQVDDFEVRIRHRDGHAVPCSMSTRLLVDPDGGPPRFVSMLRDISDRKRAEVEQARLEEQLREAHRLESIGRLAGGVAHDFNNLLTPIIGFSDLLLLGLPEGDALRPALEQIRSAGVRGKDLTSQLLAFGRRQMLQTKVVDLNGLVSGVAPMLQRLIREDLALSIDLDAGPLDVLADPSQVDQVLVNLVMNGQDAMSPGGRLYIHTDRVTLDGDDPRHPGVAPGAWAVLEVTDTGHGMDADTLARVFEPFFTTKRTGRGTGLGLATSYGIVKQHGGHLCVDSALGHGTTFRVYLPRVQSSANRVEVPSVPPPPEGGGETLLLVEDEPSVRGLARRILESHGYRVIEAGDVESAEALAAAHPGRLHLLVSDVILPGANGRELHQRLSKRQPGLRVLFMSGYTDDVIMQHGVLETGVRFLQKPFSVVDLTRKVREALDAPTPGSAE
jgi:PAS domain S-box-containing protein